MSVFIAPGHGPLPAAALRRGGGRYGIRRRGFDVVCSISHGGGPLSRLPTAHFSLLFASLRLCTRFCIRLFLFVFFFCSRKGRGVGRGVKAGCVTVGEVDASDPDRLPPATADFLGVCMPHARCAPGFVNKLRDTTGREEVVAAWCRHLTA